MYRKLYSNWLFDENTQRFYLHADDVDNATSDCISVETRKAVVLVANRKDNYLITSRFTCNGSLIRDLNPRKRPSNDSLCLMRIYKPTDIQLNDASELLEFRRGENASITMDHDNRFISIKDVSQPIGILLQLRKFGTIYVYGTTDNCDYCVTYDGEFFFFSGEKMKVVN
jgi:hypothetical protein